MKRSPNPRQGKRNIKTPYQRLAEDFAAYKTKVVYPRRVGMWSYPKARLSEGWSLLDLYERAKAAEQLGYDVILLPKDDGLHVQYVQKRPT